MLFIFIVGATRQQIVWLIELQVLSPLLGGIRLFFFVVLLLMIWRVCQILGFVSFVGSLLGTRFPPSRFFLLGFSWRGF